MDKNFGGVIWTNHALERLKQRSVKQGDAWVTWKNPDQSRYAKNKSAWIYYKTFGKEKIEVVAKKNEDNKWIILSVWSRKLDDKNLNIEDEGIIPKGNLIAKIVEKLLK